jgi:molybdenum cofactor synthesis domain-containing protein
MVEKFDLLHKTELRIERITLQGANLNDVAAVVANTLGLEQHDVLVTDVLEDVLAIDVLRQDVDVHRFVGKRDLLLKSLGRLPGVGITEATTVCSEGILGWIALDEGEARQALKRSETMAAEISRRIARRAIVFSSGTEIIGGQIEDTNKSTISKRLETEGFAVTFGPLLKDDRDDIAGQLRQTADSGGYGLVVTTGGVGAEHKDHTIEALLALDPQAATPYICRFEKGTGRHFKDGVRIGVARVSGTLIVALPGPNEEVRRSLDVLVRCLASKLDKYDLAEAIAAVLRNDLRSKMKHGEGKL